MGLFLDILAQSESQTNDTLEGIYKAFSHEHGDNWLPHESVLIRRLIELFTQRGLDRLQHVHDELLSWHAGALHKPSAQPLPQPGMMTRWSEAEVSLVHLYLEHLPPAQWTLNDHMMAVDFVVQKYLPPDALKTEAEWLATRANLMGKVQANMAAAATVAQADKILAALPSTVGAAVKMFDLPKVQAAVLEFATARCAENVRALSDTVRHKMRNAIAQDIEQRAFGQVPAGTSSLQTKLLDEFGTLNRDWRRIAITEAGEAQLQGFIASLPYGTKVKRVEQYRNACAFCRKIDGVIATVVDPAKPDKNPDTEVWVGKNNVGRSASPRKRVGDVLVEREPHERWQLPAGLAHPNCRGRWVKVAEAEGGDPDFAKWLSATLGK